MSPPKTPVRPSDFMLFAEAPPRPAPRPVLLTDPAAQSDLIRQAIFGIRPH